MPRDPRAYLWEARRSAKLIQTFVSGRSEQDYANDAMLRSAVERQFEIIGEALGHTRITGRPVRCQINQRDPVLVFQPRPRPTPATTSHHSNGFNMNPQRSVEIVVGNRGHRTRSSADRC